MLFGWEWVSCPVCESVFQIPEVDVVIRCPRCKQFIDVEDEDYSPEDRGN